ncbi:hypothetical protein [Microbulbifer sp. GL-2]|uniref:hypothetical protein n=1 Tax=Microbulbifer sp. GL-2 TaxID=2591606 RepID=UPI00117D5A24|nr:hypothetical protein [Microbulbifer sp. GL-2]
MGNIANNLRLWVKELKMEESGVWLDTSERTELDKLRRQVKQLRMEKEILKRPVLSLRKKCNKVQLYREAA